MTDKSAVNLAIATWMEPTPTEKGQVFQSPFGGTSVSPCGCWIWKPKWEDGEYIKTGLMIGNINQSIMEKSDNGSWHPADFFTDEAANARVLDNLHEPHLWRNPDGTWTCEYEDDFATDPDRKTAICMAALKFIEGVK